MTRISRTTGFRRQAQQEVMLQELNALLGRAEQEAFGGDALAPAKPLVFIVGAPRSGTTLMLQWLAASGQFAYPTNLLSRFFGAPYIGARIQQLLTDQNIDYRDELVELHAASQLDWHSEVGKTRGVLQPHEFFYFWRRFFPIDQAQKLTVEQLASSDPAGFAAGWGLIERAFQKPIAAKGILLQYDIARLAEWLPRSLFIHMRRDPFFNIQSLLQAREQVFGTRDVWFSVRPPEYEWLRHHDAYTQVAGQILFTNRSIEAELVELELHRGIPVAYESFCRDPGVVWCQLRDAFAQLGFSLDEYDGLEAFESTNVVSLSDAESGLIRRAYEKLANC